LAAEINGIMPFVVTRMVGEGLNRFSKSIRGSKVLILGVARNVSDCRESPALDVMRMLREIVAASKLVVDTRNATKDLQEFKNKIIKLGAGNNVASFPQHPDDHEKAAISLVTH
jgi:UDP-N-acetyl-D-mannosaminuronate dehydrogenase